MDHIRGELYSPLKNAVLIYMPRVVFFTDLDFVRVDGCGHAGSIQNAFDDFICSEVGRIDGDEL